MKEYTYKFRLFPTENQKTLLNKHFGSIRFVYNYFLDRRNKFYLNAKEKQLAKKSLNYLDDAKALTELKKENGKGWLYESNAQSLQHSLKHLDGAFNRFYKKLGKFPKFKSKKSKQSFRVPQNIQIKNGKICFTKFIEGIRYDKHRKIEGKIQNATIIRNSAEQYFVCIGVKKDIKNKEKKEKVVGIDLGIKTLVVCSNGDTYSNIKPQKNLEKLIRIRSKAFSRTQKNKDGIESKGRVNARRYLAKVYNKASNVRNNHLHQISSKIINENQVIILEDLNVKGMIKNKRLSKSILDCSWPELVRQITYKSNWYGRSVIKVDRFYPSSKTCNECGFINNYLTLEDRKWTCPKCKKNLNRDLNAAKNILRQGLNSKNKTVGTTELAECLSRRPIAKNDRQLIGSETHSLITSE